MTGQTIDDLRELRVTRGFAPTIGLLAALVPAMACAQTNLDQGKSASQIFASDCAECHKAARGLANGKNSAALTDFLREHYTTSRDQAAALAAYVLGGRGSEPIGAAAQGRGQKPAPEHANAAAEEPKPSKRQAKQSAKPDEGARATASTEEPKPPKHPARPAKPDEAAPATAKLQRPADDAAKPQDEANPAEQPSIMAPEPRPAAASRVRRKEPKTPAPEAPAAVARAPAAVVVDPAPSETPVREASPNPAPAAATPADTPSGQSGEATPVPRDDIPD